MGQPVMVGTIERRLLVNYRVDPEFIGRVVPAPFRPQLVGGVGIAGICLIRLGQLRPVGFPGGVGLTTENAAHRVAVEWDEPDGIRQGVYVPRRDSSSRLTALVGGRLFPGAHHRARFTVDERPDRWAVSFASHDGVAAVSVTAGLARNWSAGSIFPSIAEASAFFERAPIGYSPTHRADRYDGVELRCARWQVVPLVIDEARSTFFDDRARFPAGTVEFDSALLMLDIPAEWTARPPLIALPGAGQRVWEKSERMAPR
jgi:hypothetical protein